MSSQTGRNLRSGDIIPKGYNLGQLNNFTPQQQQLFGQLFGHLGPDSYLSKLAGGDQSMFDEIEAPAKRQFSGQIGNISSRFSQGGARRSSGFQNSATAASSNFAQELASNRQQLQRQALQDLFGMSNMLLGQRPEDRFLVEKPQKQGGGWDSFLSGLGGAIPSAAMGFLTGGPGGAVMGGASGFFGGSGNKPQYNQNISRTYGGT